MKLDTFNLVVGAAYLLACITTILSLTKCSRLFRDRKASALHILVRTVHLLILIFLYSGIILTVITSWGVDGRALFAVYMVAPFVILIPNAIFLAVDKYIPASDAWSKNTLLARWIIVLATLIIPVVNYLLCLPPGEKM